MPRTTRSARRFRRAKRELIWSTVLMDNVAAALPGGSPVNLIIPSDWTRGSNFEKGAVLLGIRGWYFVTYSSSSTLANPTWFMSIAKNELDEVPGDWTIATAYNSEDVLYTDGGAMGAAVAPIVFDGIPPTPALSRQLEVKAKRKLNSDDTITLNFQTPTAAEDWLMTGVFRCLLQLP